MLNYIILGIIQGIVEWIPISSEGIVALASQSFSNKDVNPIDIALFLHLGTFFSALIYFRKDWIRVLLLKNKKLLNFLIISTVISLIIGYLFYQFVQNIIIGNSLLLLMGFGLLATAYFHKKKLTYKMEWRKSALFSGFLQGLAVIPGLSRSGATIFGLSLSELKSHEILKVSYMMSAPVILASSIYLFFKNPNLASNGWPSLIASFIAGILSLHFLLNFSKKVNFFKFILLFAVLCLLGGFIGFIL